MLTLIPSDFTTDLSTTVFISSVLWFLEFFFYYYYFFYCIGFCHTLKWNSHGFTCVPHPNPPSHLPLHLIPLRILIQISAANISCLHHSSRPSRNLLKCWFCLLAHQGNRGNYCPKWIYFKHYSHLLLEESPSFSLVLGDKRSSPAQCLLCIWHTS